MNNAQVRMEFDTLDDQLVDAATELAAHDMPRLANAVRQARALLLVREHASCTRLVDTGEIAIEGQVLLFPNRNEATDGT